MIVNSSGSEWNFILSDDMFAAQVPIADYLRAEVTFNANNDIGHITLDLPLSYTSLLTDMGLLPTTDNPCIPSPFATLQVHHSVECGPFVLEGEDIFFINNVSDNLHPNKHRTIRLESDSSMWLLSKRYANTHSEDPRVDFPAPGIPADDVVHQLFTEFFGAAPPAGARDFIAAGLVADNGSASLGPNYITNAAYKDMLSIFQEAAEFSDSRCLPFFFGFTPTMTPSGNGERPSVPLNFQTRFDKWGSDRTVGNADGNQPVVLSSGRGNIDSFSYINDSSERVNVLYFLGEGDGAGQITATAMDNTAIAASQWAWCEASTSDTSVTDPDVAQSRADSELTRLNRGAEFPVNILDTAGGIFGGPGSGADWGLGDCVTFDYRTPLECAGNDRVAVRLDARNTSVNILLENCEQRITANFEVLTCAVCEPEGP